MPGPIVVALITGLAGAWVMLVEILRLIALFCR